MESEPTLLMVVKFVEQGMHGYALRFCFLNNFLGRTSNNVHQAIFGLNKIGFYHLDFSLFCSSYHKNSLLISDVITGNFMQSDFPVVL